MTTQERNEKFETLVNQLQAKGFEIPTTEYEKSIGSWDSTEGRIINKEGESLEDLLSALGWKKEEKQELVSSKAKGVFGTFVYWTSPDGFGIRFRSQQQVQNNKWDWNLDN